MEGDLPSSPLFVSEFKTKSFQKWLRKLQGKECHHCGRESSPLSRTNSDPLKLPVLVHQRAHRNGESHFKVSLTPSTLGYLKLDSPLQNHHNHHNFIPTNGTTLHNDDEEEESKDVYNFTTQRKKRAIAKMRAKAKRYFLGSFLEKKMANL
ncbi:hypothetical protein NE237_021496 [Protea cynaroides]|uniref:Uncharacterized protein n=1 Tax=Protea cynaroides TaxID=273540 RepID=A0A9Q0HAD4_9MAGN|nr:hypothetical protein NE237_021496 [Protea cynaroides]